MSFRLELFGSGQNASAAIRAVGGGGGFQEQAVIPAQGSRMAKANPQGDEPDSDREDVDEQKRPSPFLAPRGQALGLGSSARSGIAGSGHNAAGLGLGARWWGKEAARAQSRDRARGRNSRIATSGSRRAGAGTRAAGGA